MDEQRDDSERFQQQLRVDGIVDRVLNLFDKSEGYGGAERERSEEQLRISATHRPEEFEQAIARLEELAAEYPQDSIAHSALELLRGLRGEVRR